MILYSVKKPDMSWNLALAGKTVSSRGMNVTYNENGYAVEATNYTHRFFAQTSMSIRAPSKEAVLAGDSRTGYDGPVEDQMHFSDHEFARAVNLRRQVAEGKLSEREANSQLEEIRRLYGYSFGTSGTQYAEIVLPGRQPDDVAMAQAASVTAQTASVQSDASQEMSVQSAAPQETSAQSGALRETPVQNAAPRDADSETEQLRSSYQTQLFEQQQRQTIHSELEELRMKDLVRVNGKDRASGLLLELMDEDEDEDG